MTSTRPYRVGLPLAFAMDEIKKMRGRQFCPQAVDAFLRVLHATGASTTESPQEGNGATKSVTAEGEMSAQPNDDRAAADEPIEESDPRSSAA